MQGFNLIRRVLPVFALLSQCSSAWMFMSSSAASKQQYGSVRAQSKTMTRRTLTNTILTGLATSGAFTTINSAAIAAAGVAFQGSFSGEYACRFSATSSLHQLIRFEGSYWSELQ